MEEFYKNKPEPRKSKVGIIISLVLGLIIGAVGTYAYVEFLLPSEEKEVEVEEENITKVEEVELKTDSILVKNLVEQYMITYYSEETQIPFWYGQDELLTSNLSTEEKQMLILSQLATNTNVIDADQFQEINRLLFGENSNVPNQNITMGNMLLFTYNEEQAFYMKNPDATFGIINAVGLERKIISAVEKDEKLVITVAVGKSMPNEDDTERVYTKLDNTELDDFNLETDYDKLDKFEQHYSYDEENKNYYLEKIVKVQ